jgi:peptidoglycan/LPS O-acetylase OafA/YrhL
MNESIASANSLKGLAILVVLANHYALMFVTGAVTGYANTAISVFFFLSGYGLYRSNRRTGGFFRFMLKRIVRLYPLFLLASILSLAFVPGFSFQDFAWQIALVHGQGHFWFIPAIVQCYLLFFPARLAIDSTNRLALPAAVGLCCLTTVLVFQFDARAAIRACNFIHLFYKQILLFHAMVFVLGMLFGKLEDRPGFTPPGRPVFASMPAVAGIIAALLALQGFCKSFMPPAAFLALQIAVILCIATVSGLAVLHCARSRILAFVGGISYEIYLFHMLFYIAISKLLRQHPGQTRLLAYTLAAAALLLLASLALNKADAWLQRKVRKFIC